MKRIILCADDYGQNSAISQAIVELLRAKHLSATSCIATAPLLAEYCKYLTPFKDQADIGLHLNLTQGKPLSTGIEFSPIKELVVKAFTKKLNKAQILDEFTAQLDKFIEYFGHLPTFIDGHHHIHQLPIVREAALELYDTRLRENFCYVRCTFDPASLVGVRNVAYLKQLVIQLVGGLAFKRELVKRNIPHNHSFAGIYNFADSYAYTDLFPRFCKQVTDGGIIMCHPSLMSSLEEDEIVNSRHNEYLYFSDKKFMRELNHQSVALARFIDIHHKK
jgi:predicted glycoside hydrolase/deacetylase ChbG (UPF0249 family)